MKLYYKTLKSTTHCLYYNIHESIWALKPKIYKTIGLNILENYKFKYIGKVLNDGTFICHSTNNIHNTFEDAVRKYTCNNTVYCANGSDFKPMKNIGMYESFIKESQGLYSSQ